METSRPSGSNIPGDTIQGNLGFTLLEIVVVLALIGALAGLALPGYAHWQRQTLAREGVLVLTAMAGSQHRALLARGSYLDVDGLTAVHSLPDTLRAHYRLLVKLSPDPGFQLILEPKTPGSGYVGLTLDHLGRRSPPALWQSQ